MKKRRYVLISLVFCGLLFSAVFVHAAITIEDFNINGASSVTVKLGDSMKYNWRISATKEEVVSSCGQILSWSVTRNDLVPPDRRVVASGAINADQLLISTAQTGSGNISFTPLSGGSSEPLTLKVGCGREPGSNIILKTLVRSAPVTVNFTGQKSGKLSVKFDASPDSVAPNTSVNFNFNLQLTAKQSDLDDCRSGASAPVKWEVYKLPAASQQDDFSRSNLVQEGALTVSSFGTASPTTERISFNKSVLTLDRDFVFKARISCDRLGVDELTTSSAVPIKSGGAGTGDTGTGCGTPGQPACQSGETQKYEFKIDNPLKGGASDFTSLVKIIAQWIFNLAIPIAVAMIVYSGILFLTAAGEPAKVTKAKDVLKYAVIGLAIILIGSGFVTLIQSILELGGTKQEIQLGPGAPPEEDYGPPAPRLEGNKCSRDRDCLLGLKCKNTICQKPTGNLVGEPCSGGASCDVGLACDTTSEGRQVIDGQILGTCFETSAAGGRIGDVCQKDKDCISGFKCNQICQRKDGNLNGEVCLKTSISSNCKSTACSTIGANIEGFCVDNPTN